MGVEDKDPIYLDVCQQLDAVCKRVQEKVDKDQQQLKARKKNTELEKKIEQEMKKNAELLRQLEEVSSRYTELDRRAMFPGHLTIADNDQTRLEQAKLSYDVAKELTGVRFDYMAPPNICKGYSLISADTETSLNLGIQQEKLSKSEDYTTNDVLKTFELKLEVTKLTSELASTQNQLEEVIIENNGLRRTTEKLHRDIETLNDSLPDRIEP